MFQTVRHSLLLPLLLPLFYHFASVTGYGVGFHLSLDYGVASVYFSNGSAVDVAKIEGESNYQQVMRAAYMPQDDTSHSSQINFAHEIKKDNLNLQSLRDYLSSWSPSWPGHEDRHYQSLVLMLKALKTATESYLEHGISTAEIVAPFPVTDIYRNTLRSACSAASLCTPNSALDPAGVFAARAHDIGNRHCRDSVRELTAGYNPQQLVLTVDYSRSALTALLVHEDCGVFEVRRVRHSTELGLNQLHKGSDSDLGLKKMESSLREIVKLPMNDGGNGEELTNINNLVLLGESADNSQLHMVLKKVLGEQFGRFSDPARQRVINSINPLFAASRGVALDCWGRLRFEENGVGSHGCLI